MSPLGNFLSPLNITINVFIKKLFSSLGIFYLGELYFSFQITPRKKIVPRVIFPFEVAMGRK
jgi:hypothetical protein